MDRVRQKIVRRKRRRQQVRKRVFGTPQRPRLTVFRSLKNIYAQIIDDTAGRTLVSVSSRDKDLRESVGGGSNAAAASKVGAALGERARSSGVEAVAFDRNGYRYHGRVKALADAAREAGLKF
ncbi:MAG TPA: 50S ribosomal protein L18 [Phycisphaerae bacterium]|nr:50S ribosomal protein L18 [Phycisphaerae bacterium]